MTRGQIVTVILVLQLMTWPVTLSAAPSVPTRPRSPAESLASFQVHPSFRVELVAAEPLVVDPIAISWGADGKIWVVEMGGYPTATGGGRVRFLEDRDADGQIDSSQVFLEGLTYPTSVLPWREGVLVACAPDIFYAEDTDGDGQADIREVLFSGFGQGNPQHRVNSLRWGLDNWVHCANGDSGGLVRSRITGEQVSILGFDARVCPTRGFLERLSGASQFGRDHDDWGNWFGCRNLWPAWHVVLEHQYLRRNPFLPESPTIRHLMTPPTGAPVYPVSGNLPRYNEPDSANRFTSACGLGIYRDDLFGEAFLGSYFVCEPAHNLVRHEVMTRSGVSFVSRNAAGKEKEFLASSDPWFRPTQVRTGPDGALWCVDMYRAVIEHPEYMLKHAELPLRQGAQQGRIYRVVPVGTQLRRVPNLKRLGTRAAAECLNTPNGPVRDLVQQTLVTRQDPAALEVLRRLALSDDRAEVRLSALCTLDGLSANDPLTLTAALADPHPAIRRRAIRISEPMLPRSASLQTSVLQLIDDTDCQVRLQLVCSLGEWNSPPAGRALAQIVSVNGDDPFMAAAALSSATNHALPMLRGLLAKPNSENHLQMIKSLTRYACVNHQQETLALVLREIALHSAIDAGDWHLDLLADFLEQLDDRSSSLSQLRHESGQELREAIDHLSGLIEEAASVVLDENRPASQRALAARVLVGARRDGADLAALAKLLNPRTPNALQEAIVAALARHGNAEVPVLLLDGWHSHFPTIRMRIIDALLSRTEWSHGLLDHVDSGEVSPAIFSLAHRGQLLLHNDAKLRRRAGQLLSRPQQSPPRAIEQYLSAQAKGEKAAGERLFRMHCASCHRFREVGSNVGPDLDTLQDRSAAKLASDLLDPSRHVEPRYVTYIAETADGRIFSGILKSATAGTITLLAGESKEYIISRSNLLGLESTDRSLMPENWDQVLTNQEIADLIEYLR